MEKKWIVFGLVIATLVFSVGLGLAAKPETPQRGRATVVMPEHAVKVAPNVFYLGTAVDKGRVVEGYAIVDYKERFVKPGTECGNGICEPGENARKCPADCTDGGDEPDTSSCYGFLSRGAKWKTLEPYIVNPANTKGLDGQFVTDNFAMDIGKWETAADVDILGEGSSTTETLVADLESTDGKNEVYFGSIEEPNVIAVTIIWGIFGGPPPFRELVEWDQVYDDEDFDWSADCLSEDCTSKMDFENIATHELGHSVGLDDLYDTMCSEQTMYGYAVNGETKKRDLNTGDITGIQKLYG